MKEKSFVNMYRFCEENKKVLPKDRGLAMK
jgi:hypothetical protein